MASRHALLAGCSAMFMALVAIPNMAHAAVTTDDRLRSILENDAACLVEYRRPQVNAFLRVDPGSPGFDRQARLFGQNSCMEGDRLSYEPRQLRGALFIALYRARSGSGEPELVEPAKVATAWPPSKNPQFAAMQDFAACVVRADPADSRRIVMAVPVSSEENAAVAVLRPHLDACLSKGGSITFNRMALSGMLAEALYRLAPATPGSGT